VHKRMSIFNIRRFVCNIRRFIECFLNTILLTFVPIGVNTCTYSLQHAYKVRTFYIKTMRYSFLLDDKYKCTTTVRDKDHKITKIHHFVAWYKHSNVTSNIRMLQHSKVHSNVEHSFMHYWQRQVYASDVLSLHCSLCLMESLSIRHSPSLLVLRNLLQWLHSQGSGDTVE